MAKDDKKPERDASKEEKDEEKEGAEDESEGGEASTEESDHGKKKLSKKKMIIFAAVGLVVILGGVGAGLYFGGVIGNKDASSESQGGEVKGAPIFFPLGDILVNLSGEGKHPNYLKIKVTLELADEKDKALMETLKPRIIDNFQVYLRELRIEDLRGSAGLYRLREELLLRVTEAAQPVRVRDVLFQEILVQ